MIKPKYIFHDLFPINFIGDSLYVQRNNEIGIINEDFRFLKKFDIPNPTIINKTFNSIPILRRLFRFGSHRIRLLGDTFFLLYNHGIYVANSNSKVFKSYFLDFMGRRPLNFNSSGNEIVFGEYFTNNNRLKPVKIYSISDKNGIEIIHEFKPGEIRHIHNCIYDKEKMCWWILSGDTNNESNIYKLENGIVKKIIGGSQKYRAVEIIPENNTLIIATDTPLEKNSINTIKLHDLTFSKTHDIQGSAFHAKKISDYYFVTTVTEPSSINNVNSAALYCSFDGEEWKKLFEIDKDIFPVGYQKYFRHTELRPLDNLFISKYLVIEARATRKVSHGMILFDINEIENFFT